MLSLLLPLLIHRKPKHLPDRSFPFQTMGDNFLNLCMVESDWGKWPGFIIRNGAPGMIRIKLLGVPSATKEFPKENVEDLHKVCFP